MSNLSDKKVKIKKSALLEEKLYIGKKGYGLKKDLFSSEKI